LCDKIQSLQNAWLWIRFEGFCFIFNEIGGHHNAGLGVGRSGHSGFWAQGW